MILLQSNLSIGGSIIGFLSFVLIIFVLVFITLKVIPKSNLTFRMWALAYNINHFGHGSFEVNSSVKEIVTILMEKNGIKVNELDIAHEIGSRYHGILYSDEGNFSVMIWADRSGNVQYTINDRIES